VKLGGTTRAAGAVAALVVHAAKSPAAGVTAETLHTLFQRHASALPEKPYLATALAAVSGNGAWLLRHTEELCRWLESQ